MHTATAPAQFRPCKGSGLRLQEPWNERVGQRHDPVLRQPGDAPGQVWGTFSTPATSLQASSSRPTSCRDLMATVQGEWERLSVWREGDRGTTPRLEEGALTPAAGQLQAEPPLGCPEEPALSY